MGVRRPAIYALLAIPLWIAVLNSGVHATIAGVLAALTIPTTRRIDSKRFLQGARSVLNQLEEADKTEDQSTVSEAQQSALMTLEDASEKVQSPLSRIEHALHPWVAFAIMPIFAFANAGVALDGGLESLSNPIGVGIILGLILGKPIGVLIFSWLTLRLRLAVLPQSVSKTQLVGAGILAGVGFTMSLFIANLAFAEATQLSIAKIGIISGSFIAAITGFVLLNRTGERVIT